MTTARPTTPPDPSTRVVPGADHAALLADALFQVKKVVVGQDRLVERVMVCLLADGHCLIEGFPGLAKTLTVSTMAQAVGGDFARLQFTPDLVPADLVGTRTWRPSQGGLRHRVGPALREHRARGRDQPRPRQGAVGAARGDGRAARVDRRRDPPAAAAVPRPRHPEPDRVRGRVRPARGAARPVPHARRGPAARRTRRRSRSPTAWASAAPHGRAGAHARAARRAAGRRPRRVRPPRGAGLRRAPRHGDPRAGALGPGRPRPPDRPRRQPARHAGPASPRPGRWPCSAAAGTSCRRTCTTWRPRCCGTASRSPTTRWPRACTPRTWSRQLLGRVPAPRIAPPAGRRPRDAAVRRRCPTAAG